MTTHPNPLFSLVRVSEQRRYTDDDEKLTMNVLSILVSVTQARIHENTHLVVSSCSKVSMKLVMRYR